MEITKYKISLVLKLLHNVYDRNAFLAGKTLSKTFRKIRNEIEIHLYIDQNTFKNEKNLICDLLKNLPFVIWTFYVI